MPKKEIARLMAGFRHFREKYYLSDDTTYSNLKTGLQGPKTLLIGCSDSRVDPAILGGTGPGEVFVVRNVANLVPPYEVGGGKHGVSAAIEFAVVNLKVENVIILGHRQCGGIRALLFPEESQAGGFVQTWMKIAEPAKGRALAALPGAEQTELLRCCELESIRTSVENLRSFPFVAQAARDRGMAIMGIYFDIEKGELLELDEPSGNFTTIVI
ncbi:MAG: carbonic anhydrase [Bdellovibrionota bacterium]